MSALAGSQQPSLPVLDCHAGAADAKKGGGRCADALGGEEQSSWGREWVSPIVVEIVVVDGWIVRKISTNLWFVLVGTYKKGQSAPLLSLFLSDTLELELLPKYTATVTILRVQCTFL